MIRIIHKFKHALRGIGYVVLHDRGTQAILITGGVGILFLQHFFGPISNEGNLLLTICFFLVVITEMQNTALETALDKVHPDRHEDIKRSKDIKAGAVLCAVIFSLICALYIALGLI